MSHIPPSAAPSWHTVIDPAADPGDGGHRYRRVGVGAPGEAGTPVAWPGGHAYDRPTAATDISTLGAGPAAPQAFAPAARAPMAAKVLAVHVAHGDVVAPGALLVVLEAMKMEHRLVACARAKITAVRVRAGDAVAHGATLVVMEPADA